MSARDFMNSGSLASTSYIEAEDADPRVGLVNLADVMLVFACGLMLALVSFWNLDISQMTEVMEADEMAEVEGIEDLEDQLNDGAGSSFTELGMVYQDPMTGKMYMLKEDIGDDAAGAQGAGSDGAASGQGQADGQDAQGQADGQGAQGQADGQGAQGQAGAGAAGQPAGQDSTQETAQGEGTE